MANTVSYGFIGLDHLFSQRVSEVNVETIDTAIAETVEEHNRQANGLIAELAERTTAYTARFRQRDAGTLQPLDEWGNPLPRKPAGYYDVAYPLIGGGTAWGDNRVSRAMATVGDVNRSMLEMLGDDSDWVRRHMLAALLDDGTWAFEDQEHGSLTIEPLADGGAETYPRTNGTVSTDTHHKAQANDIDDGADNPLPDIYDELNEHPVNGGPFVVYIPDNVVDDVEDLAAFHPVGDPNIRFGDDQDQLVTSIDRGFGDEVLGYAHNLWVIRWSFLPDDYLLGVARGASEPVLKMREYPAASLQGLFTENHSPDGNLREYRFLRYCGFGVHNRVGAVVYFVNAGDTNYDTPSGYDRPIGV